MYYVDDKAIENKTMDPRKIFEDEMNKAFQKLTTDIIPSDENMKNMNVSTSNVNFILFCSFRSHHNIFSYWLDCEAASKQEQIQNWPSLHCWKYW